MTHKNKGFIPKLLPLLLISKPEFSHISSTIVREIIKGGGNAKPFLPEGVQF